MTIGNYLRYYEDPVVNLPPEPYQARTLNLLAYRLPCDIFDTCAKPPLLDAVDWATRFDSEGEPAQLGWQLCCFASKANTFTASIVMKWHTCN